MTNYKEIYDSIIKHSIDVSGCLIDYITIGINKDGYSVERISLTSSHYENILTMQKISDDSNFLFWVCDDDFQNYVSQSRKKQHNPYGLSIFECVKRYTKKIKSDKIDLKLKDILIYEEV